MREVHAHVRLVVGVVKVVDPCRGVGIYVDYIGVDEVIGAGEGAGDSLAYNLSVIVDIGGVLGDERELGGDRTVGVILATGGVETVFALGRLGVVVYLVAIVELLGVEFLDAGDGVDAVEALDGALLVLVGVAPGYGLGPVEVGCHGVALAVFLDFILLVASVGGVGETLADDGVAHPEHKLLVFGVGDFGLVHPESVDRHAALVGLEIPERVVLGGAHLDRAAAHEHHAVGGRFGPRGAPHAGDFSSHGVAAACGAAHGHAHKEECGEYM